MFAVRLAATASKTPCPLEGARNSGGQCGHPRHRCHPQSPSVLCFGGGPFYLGSSGLTHLSVPRTPPSASPVPHCGPPVSPGPAGFPEGAHLPGGVSTGSRTPFCAASIPGSLSSHLKPDRAEVSDRAEPRVPALAARRPPANRRAARTLPPPLTGSLAMCSQVVVRWRWGQSYCGHRAVRGV